MLQKPHPREVWLDLHTYSPRCHKCVKKRPIAYAKFNRDSYESRLDMQVDAHGVVLGWLLAARKPFKPDSVWVTQLNTAGARMAISCEEAFQARLVGCYTNDDDVACDCGCCSRKQTRSMA
ncbi:hypothetical protein Tco_1116959 [Tanacetum coccineum]